MTTGSKRVLLGFLKAFEPLRSFFVGFSAMMNDARHLLEVISISHYLTLMKTWYQ